MKTEQEHRTERETRGAPVFAGQRRGKAGFTLVEISIAAAILVIAVGMAMAGLTYVLRSASLSNTQNELDIQVQGSMERLKRDLRLTSLDKVFYYPSGAGPYNAISFPLARDDDGDGTVETDVDNHIIWDQTIVYHVWMSTPYQLRCTVFDPRDNDLTDAQRQTQLNSVVANGNGSSTHNGANARTSVIFENLFSWRVTPGSSTFDSYASSLSREIGVYLGSCVLSNGTHTFTFTVKGKRSESSGYKIGIDSLYVSPSYGWREAEAQLPASAQAGAVAQEQYMAGGSWDGNYQLYFPASAVDNTFTLSMENDRWEETHFMGTGHYGENTTVIFDQTCTPYDFVLSTSVYTNIGGTNFYWPTNYFVSQIYDTRVADPTYSAIDWHESKPAGTDIYLKVRSGDNDDLSDAADWAALSPMYAPGSINPGPGRYIQFLAYLQPDASLTQTPKLKDVTVKWAGETAVVDIGGTFTKGPDYGIWELKVDGQRILTGLNVYLEIFRDALGYLGDTTLTSALNTEVKPRNTGK